MKLSTEEIEVLTFILDNEDFSQLSPDYQKIISSLRSKLSGTGTVELFVDGAADLHSGTAGIGGVFYRNGEELYSFSEFIGSKTNNEAEYEALIRGIKEAHNLKLLSLNIFADSQLVVRQITGEYKVKHERMKPLHKQALELLDKLENWNIEHVLRDKNTRADALSKSGMEKGRE
ncbi:MAG: ribonuclease HI family protein [Candidatus Marinimicrobia bacterium]|jgi:ribonuclease HI|nr:ribonuclease H [Candidatus Neomarinimicrobiota bacterium]MDP6142803.1 ribonuclease HI family protein [Candidatus Neomarinimicrobiota bacterium]MDP6261762.1 ribonuclease HI family protein [Candidatus Neomarinimicrobiota bacterium]MDP7128401.1 ribonuclease HI family protein [Candidatus Neomarinimicrobiota bacterium]MDP7336655.1 ribonuclease HI family protein [Candidatus Neomarinimicrobiota bacterium]|tara:strand:- start:105 stop:629 length:525 start_codon:yes stop_codon:yes gene_type:complete